MKEFAEIFGTTVLYVGIGGLVALAASVLIVAVKDPISDFMRDNDTFHVLLLTAMCLIGLHDAFSKSGGTVTPKAIIVWDDGLHDAGTKVDTNDLRNITFRWTYDDWIPNVATVDIKAYDIHTVNPDPNVDRGFYVCNGVPITDKTAMVLMETDATNYCFYVSQSYIPDAPVVTNGVYHIHAVGTNNVWVPIGLKIFEDSRIISPQGEIR